MHLGRENAPSLAADVFMRHISHMIASLDYSVKSTTAASIPLLEIFGAWGILTSIGRRRFNNFMGRLRITRPPQPIYVWTLRATKFSDFDASQIIHAESADRRKVILRFGPDSDQSYRDWITPVRLFGAFAISIYQTFRIQIYLISSAISKLPNQ